MFFDEFVSNKSEVTCIPDGCLENIMDCTLNRIHIFCFVLLPKDFCGPLLLVV